MWIFDTGASRHMTSNLSFFKNIASISSTPAELPDGTFQVAKVQGNVDLGSNIKLSNVLYVPNFHCNLVSIT